MVEEGKNQLDRIRLEETREDEDEDRISSLPDCLLVEIVSRLADTQYAVRTRALSKRWKHVWKLVLDLIFVSRVYRPSDDFVSFVDKTLTQRGQMQLKSFVMRSGYYRRFEPQVRNWVRYAISCNVEKFNLNLWGLERQIHFPLDQCFCINSCFTELDLSICDFNPIGGISWKNLRILHIFRGYLDEHSLEKLLSGSPVLETLVLKDCYVPDGPINITSKSLKKLSYCGTMAPAPIYPDGHPDYVIEINAPNIMSLEVHTNLYLWKLLLINVSSLVEADLDYSKEGYYRTPLKEDEEEMLKGLIFNLCHVNELKMGSGCLNVLSRLRVKGFSLPSNLKLSDDLPELSSDESDNSDSDESSDEEMLLLDDDDDDDDALSDDLLELSSDESDNSDSDESSDEEMLLPDDGAL